MNRLEKRIYDQMTQADWLVYFRSGLSLVTIADCIGCCLTTVETKHRAFRVAS